jgi:hypothetical protein
MDKDALPAQGFPKGMALHQITRQDTPSRW